VTGTIRVVLLEMPQMMRDILRRTMADQPDIELIDEEPPADSENPATPHVVLVGTEAPAGADKTSMLLARWPRARIIAVEVSGRQASLYELMPYKTELGQLSPSELLEGIRAAARSGPSLDGRVFSLWRSKPH
jgi:DNA-binding NarL/FixJ family response regulator